MSSWNANIDKTKYLIINSLMRESTDKLSVSTQAKPYMILVIMISLTMNNLSYTKVLILFFHLATWIYWFYVTLELLFRDKKKTDWSIINVKPLNKKL